MQKNIAKDFWKFFSVTKNCWLWKGGKNSDGYGIFNINNKSVKAHRFSYTLHFGKIPKGKSVLHSCDVRSCVNPSHFFLGTQLDNIEDMVAKGRNRTAHGEANGRSKLTRKDCKRIKEKYKNRIVTQRALAKQFKICQHTICKIVNNISYQA